MIDRSVALGARGFAWPVAFALSCASGPAHFNTGNAALPERRTPGVAIDPQSHTPPPTATAPARKGTLALSAPADTGAAVSVVHEFFDAVAQEQLERLTELFDAEGRLWAGRRRQRVSLRTAWARRFSRLDYTQLTRSLMFRDQDIEVYRGNEASALEDSRDLPVLPRGDEVLVRVRLLERAPAGGERLFGDEVIFLLRPDADRYKITQMREDFRLP